MYAKMTWVAGVAANSIAKNGNDRDAVLKAVYQIADQMGNRYCGDCTDEDRIVVNRVLSGMVAPQQLGDLARFIDERIDEQKQHRHYFLSEDLPGAGVYDENIDNLTAWRNFLDAVIGRQLQIEAEFSGLFSQGIYPYSASQGVEMANNLPALGMVRLK